MNIIIVGCGKVGQTLAGQLNEEGNNITVIDLSAESVNDVTNRYDVMGIVGNGATHTVQKEAGIDNANLLIAVTGSDELNLLCCLIAKKAGNCQTIARVKNPIYSAEAPYLKDELGLAMVINPEYATAQEIARIMRFPSAIKIETFAKGRVELLKFRLPEDSRLIGMSVKDMIIKLKCDILVCTVERGNEAYIANGDFVFEGPFPIQQGVNLLPYAGGVGPSWDHATVDAPALPVPIPAHNLVFQAVVLRVHAHCQKQNARRHCRSVIKQQTRLMVITIGRVFGYCFDGAAPMAPSDEGAVSEAD